MVVVVEPQHLLGLFLFDIIYLHQSPCIHYGQIRSEQGFLWYNIPRKVPVTLRGLVRFLFICVIIKVHHRQRATRKLVALIFLPLNIQYKCTIKTHKIF